MSNLLDSASIVLTPTAYDNGRMLSVKPSVALGRNLKLLLMATLQRIVLDGCESNAELDIL